MFGKKQPQHTSKVIEDREVQRGVDADSARYGADPNVMEGGVAYPRGSNLGVRRSVWEADHPGQEPSWDAAERWGE